MDWFSNLDDIDGIGRGVVREYDIYLLTAVGLIPGAVVEYKFTHKQYIEQHNEYGIYGTEHT